MHRKDSNASVALSKGAGGNGLSAVTVPLPPESPQADAILLAPYESILHRPFVLH
jgi:hypothetical protein